MLVENIKLLNTDDKEFLQDLKEVLMKHNAEIVIKIDSTVFKLTERGEESFIYKNK